MNHTIVGLVGASGAGKSTLADLLVTEFHFVKFHTGTPLKTMLMAFGLTEYDVSGPPEHRSVPRDELCGRSVRFALSTLGTQWGRETIGENIWSRNLQKRLLSYLNNSNAHRCIVIDDLRYPSDWNVIKELGGQIVTVRRPSAEMKRSVLDIAAYRYGIRHVLPRWALSRLLSHESEYHWRDAPSAFEIQNSSTPRDMANTMRHKLELCL